MYGYIAFYLSLTLVMAVMDFFKRQYLFKHEDNLMLDIFYIIL